MDTSRHNGNRETARAGAGMHQSRFEALLNGTGTRFVYPRNAIIFVQSARDQKLYYIRSGVVKYSFFTPAGAEKIVQFIGPHEIFGESAVLLDHCYGITATALSQVDVIILTKEQTLELLRTNGEFAELLAKALAAKLWRFGTHVVASTFYDTHGRVAQALLQLGGVIGSQGNPGEGDQSVAITHQDLADYIGTNRVTVTRALRGLEKGNLITCRRGRIEIRDQQGLRHWAQVHSR